ncbi:MAG: PASTA domain-containing protein [Pseudomonadota bacterium]
MAANSSLNWLIRSACAVLFLVLRAQAQDAIANMPDVSRLTLSEANDRIEEQVSSIRRIQARQPELRLEPQLAFCGLASASRSVVVWQSPAANDPLNVNCFLNDRADDGGVVCTISYDLIISGMPDPNQFPNAIVLTGDSRCPAPVSFSATRAPAPQRILVPDVEGLSEDRARDELKVRGLASSSQNQRDWTNSPGTVLDQQPAANTPVIPGSNVTLIISEAYPTPNFQGRTIDAAEEVADRIGLTLKETEVIAPNNVPGVIVGQSPAPRANIPKSGVVEVDVSKKLVVPPFVGSTISEAEELASLLQLKLVVRENVTLETAEGIVFSQDPEAGQAIPRNREVVIDVSLGPPVVPPTKLTDKESYRPLIVLLVIGGVGTIVAIVLSVNGGTTPVAPSPSNLNPLEVRIRTDSGVQTIQDGHEEGAVGYAYRVRADSGVQTFSPRKKDLLEE